MIKNQESNKDILTKITPLILTYNEAPNIERTLKQLTWAQQIIIIDSYSKDETLEIIKNYPQVKLFQREFDTHASQWNYGLKKVASEWVLSLDADYFVTDELIAEIKEIKGDRSIDGYFIPFKYCVFGKPLRGTILPPRQALFRQENSIYIDDGHTQLLQIKGKSPTLSNYIYHDDRKPLSRWLWAQDRYMKIEVKKLLETPKNELSFGDQIRLQKVIAPFIIIFYCLILKGGILDGWHGWYYAFQRMFAEILLSIRLIEKEQLETNERNKNF
ncbi:MAG: glycosyltransferase family 2 protein [Gomphosphaeria aponina SAG 52.96 = DSM 107014]|uniref:Glycosyltransferase family 2 protein n=1 Tax=Gomphosphaeria aponina SAG 52.96 = DSM 107014 TaxID=1521640 RepID=A0A941JNG2_9CHRO|nr:glycosyltransferase family 2 protein [Gomphosphaeria aponina SAG 52.96 = DSM 107014]